MPAPGNRGLLSPAISPSPLNPHASPANAMRETDLARRSGTQLPVLVPVSDQGARELTGGLC